MCEICKQLGPRAFAVGGGITVTVAQAHHALMNFHRMVAATSAAKNQEASRAGLMAACIAIALGWTQEQGEDAIENNPGFLKLLAVMQGMYYTLAAQGLFPPRATS